MLERKRQIGPRSDEKVSESPKRPRESGRLDFEAVARQAQVQKS